MQESNNNKTSRAPFLILIAGVIIVIHIAVIFAVKGCSRTESQESKPQSQPAVTAAEKKADSPGFWKKLFSGKKKNSADASKESVKQQTAVQEPLPEVKPAKTITLYRKNVTDVPGFGTAFDFSKAKHGNLPESLVPGSKLAKSGIIVDLSSRKVLWEKNCNLKTGTASMAKLMTLLLFMEHLDANPDITLDSEVTVPPGVMKVPRTGVVYLAPGEKFIYSDIVKAASIKSANDAAEMLAICVDGDSGKFTARMNRKAAELGMKNSRFVNAHGLTEKTGKNQNDFSTSTALDMVILAERLLEYPVLMSYFSTQQESLRKVKPLVYTNTNRLINPRYPGVDGMKTGFTRAAGFCLTFSAKRNGKRVMGCVTGFKSRVDRDRFCRKLVDWAYNPDKPAVKEAAKDAAKPSRKVQNTKKQTSRSTVSKKR